MSDLQCPATFLVVGWSSVPREPEGVELADQLRDRRIASVCSGRDATTLAVATALAGQLGVAHRSIDGLEPLPARPECADAHDADATGRAFAGADAQDAGTPSARHRAALDALADLHRGETVLVVAHASVLATLWPAARSPDEEDALPPYRLVTVQVDGDGWRLLGRPTGG
jgi:2,3-bisphosphoglycerate-dependent phosphoglycerate mutase